MSLSVVVKRAPHLDTFGWRLIRFWINAHSLQVVDLHRFSEKGYVVCIIWQQVVTQLYGIIYIYFSVEL